MRILIAKVSHETNTFSPVPTPVARFCPDGETLLTGQAAIDFYQGTTSCIGRYLAIADELGAEVVLPVAAAAPPSRPVDDDCLLYTLDVYKRQSLHRDRHGSDIAQRGSQRAVGAGSVYGRHCFGRLWRLSLGLCGRRRQGVP